SKREKLCHVCWRSHQGEQPPGNEGEHAQADCEPRLLPLGCMHALTYYAIHETHQFRILLHVVAQVLKKFRALDEPRKISCERRALGQGLWAPIPKLLTETVNFTGECVAQVRLIARKRHDILLYS